MSSSAQSTETTWESFYRPSTFRKSNFLIQARYNYTLLQNLILAYSLFVCKKKEGQYVAEFSVQELSNALGKEYNDFYGQVQKSGKKMNATQICMEDPVSQRYEYYQLIPTFKYNKGNCIIKFNTDLNYAIGDFTDKYTPLSMDMLSQIDSVNTYRLYETIKSKAFYPKDYTGPRNGKYIMSFSVAELKILFNAVDISRKEIAELMDKSDFIDYEKILSVAKELYEKEKDLDIPTKDKFPMPKWNDFKDFKKRCITPSISEINEKTEYFVTYDTERSNRQTKNIVFYVTEKDKESSVIDSIAVDITGVDNLIDEIRAIIKENLSTGEIRSILSAADNDVEKVKKAYELAQQGDRTNLVGFMISAIKNNYPEPVKSKKKVKNSFEFSNQRNYDFEALEKMYLNQ